MASRPLLIAGSILAIAGVVWGVLSWYGLLFPFLGQILVALGVTVDIIAIGLKNPVVAVVIFAIIATLLLGIDLRGWFGLPPFL